MLNAAFESPAQAYIPTLGRIVDGKMQELIVPSRNFVSYLDAVSEEATKTKHEPVEPKSPNGAAAIADAPILSQQAS
jgi:hypothetical protein